MVMFPGNPVSTPIAPVPAKADSTQVTVITAEAGIRSASDILALNRPRLAQHVVLRNDAFSLHGVVTAETVGRAVRSSFFWAALFAIVDSTSNVARGKISFEKGITLIAADTVAYGLVGLAGSTVGSLVTSACATAVPGLGLLIPVLATGATLLVALGLGNVYARQFRPSET